MRYRVLIAVLGLVVAFVGLVAWSIEGEYGSGRNFLIQTHQGGPAIVYDVDEEEGTRTQVFEGSPREALAYMERPEIRRRELPHPYAGNRRWGGPCDAGSGSAGAAAEAHLTPAATRPGLNAGLAVRRRLSVRPLPSGDAESAHPVHLQAALRAVEYEVLKLTFEIGLHLQELQTQHLGMVTSGSDRPCPTPIASSTRSSAFAACSAMVWTACSRISRSPRAMAGMVGPHADEEPAMVRVRIRVPPARTSRFTMPSVRSPASPVGRGKGRSPEALSL